MDTLETFNELSDEDKVKWMIEENQRRWKNLQADYNPLTGEGAPGERVKIEIPDYVIPVQWVPKTMLEDKLIKIILKCKTIKNFIRTYLRDKSSKKTKVTQEEYDEVVKQMSIIRNQHDFCYWAYTCVKIKNKEGGEMIPFQLNYAQVVTLLEYEKKRLSNQPIFFIICKARQWGGSTLTQIYMSWIQLCHKKAWYSTIVAQTKTTAARILEMYSKMIDRYPPWALGLPNTETLSLGPYGKGGANNDFTIKDKRGKAINDTVIQIGSVMEPDNIRGGDVALIHYSEVGVWKDTPGRRPEDLIRGLSGGLVMRPYTMEILESTPKGVGNFFHREYVRAKNGTSTRTALFIPWYYIKHDTYPLDETPEEFAKWLLHKCRGREQEPEGWLDSGDYYWQLWLKGATFEGLNWYRIYRKSCNSHADIASEAPSDDIEAFQFSGKPMFDVYHLNALREKCNELYRLGEIVSGTEEIKGGLCLQALSFKKSDRGLLKMWKTSEPNENVRDRYLVVVDIGGRWKGADFSIITVFDRFCMMMGGKPEIVAEWRGHIDHDLLAWKATQIAKYYCNALLVIESNTLETKDKNRDTDGNDVEYILDVISRAYDNLYARERGGDDIAGGIGTKWGFHTNIQTKPAIIHHLVACVRDRVWVERNSVACDEMQCYEKKDDGTFGAQDGQKDDLVMTRAIGLWICFRSMEMPAYVFKNNSTGTFRVRSEAHI